MADQELTKEQKFILEAAKVAGELVENSRLNKLSLVKMMRLASGYMSLKDAIATVDIAILREAQFIEETRERHNSYTSMQDEIVKTVIANLK